jgi:hypothetical protein
MAVTVTTIQERSWGDVFDVIDRVATETNSSVTGATTPAATTAVAGKVKQITFTAQQSPDFADLAAVTVAYNALLTKFIAAGIMPAS